MEESIIWKWKHSSQPYKKVLCEVEPGFLILYPEGKIESEGVKELFCFLKSYSEKKHKSICLLIDNTKVTSIENEARQFVIDFIKKNDIINKAATFGSNIFISNIMNILVAIMSKMKLIHHSFSTKEGALNWLKK